MFDALKVFSIVALFLIVAEVYGRIVWIIFFGWIAIWLIAKVIWFFIPKGRRRKK